MGRRTIRTTTRVPACALFLTAMWAARGEIVDRVAVIVKQTAITASAIEEQLRVAALLDKAPVDLGSAARRRMAERLIEQVLLRHEMEITRFAQPPDKDVDLALASLRKERPALAAEMAGYGVTESTLRRNLANQLATLRFIEMRFRPGSSVSDGEVDDYYREEFAPQFQKRSPGREVPPADDVRDDIEAILLQRKVDRALDQWLKEERSRAPVRFIEEAFQ